MDTYSYISENGTTRQIIDLVAQAKDSEQDVRIALLEQQVSRPWVALWQGELTSPGVIPLAGSLMDYEEISVVATLLGSAEANARIHVVNIPKLFYGVVGTSAKAYGISTTAYEATSYVNFRVNPNAPNEINVTSMGSIPGYQTKVLGVYARK